MPVSGAIEGVALAQYSAAIRGRRLGREAPRRRPRRWLGRGVVGYDMIGHTRGELSVEYRRAGSVRPGYDRAGHEPRGLTDVQKRRRL